jgi:FkbM family methyltransferase
MFDAADTEYYLATGHRVLAIEAHPGYAKRASDRLQAHIDSGQLSILNVAIAESAGPVTLHLDATNGGGHSIVNGLVAPGSSVDVPGRRMTDVLSEVGARAKLIKIDIEGADHLCLQALTRENRPEFLSCEMHDALADQLPHLTAIGFTQFKLIDQTTFRELAEGTPIIDRLALGVARRLGFGDHRMVRRAGRWFTLYFSSGPAPWESSGRWHSVETTIRLFEQFKRSNRRNVWLDLHAC